MSDEPHQQEPSHTRRGLLASGSIAAASIALAGFARAEQASAEPNAAADRAGTQKLSKNFNKTSDGTEIYFKDSGVGRPIVFSHGWPLTADAWDNASNSIHKEVIHERFRTISHSTGSAQAAVSGGTDDEDSCTRPVYVAADARAD